MFDSDAPLSRAKTPPASWYTNPQHNDLERRAVLDANWQAVTAAHRVAQPGHYVAGCAGGEPWVVVRGNDGVLRAFANVCRHNGTQVAQGEGYAEQLTCPYHGWRYDLEGRLSKAPRLAGIDGFERNDYALKPLQVEVFGPVVMLNISNRAERPKLGELEQRLTRLDWQTLRPATRRSYILECNWKVFVDNYLDGGYHVPFLHRRLASELDLSGYQTELFDGFSIQSVHAAQDAGQRLAGEALYAWVYPNLMINRYGNMMDTNVVTPLSATRCRVDFEWYTTTELDEDTLHAQLKASEEVQDEDIAICESLQVGMGSRHFEPGPYAPSVEMGKYQFHRMVAADLAKAS